MNIHPVFVHFPIAFLTIYGVLELIRFKKLTARPELFYVKAVLVLVGFSGACLAWLTGDIAKSLIPRASLPPQIHLHENFAQTTTVIFGLLAGGYAAEWLDRLGLGAKLQNTFLNPLWKLILMIKHWLIETPLVFLLALAGLVCVFTTGALGGSMVYGPQSDPFISFVYNLLVK